MDNVAAPAYPDGMVSSDRELTSDGWFSRQPAAFQAALAEIIQPRVVTAGTIFNRGGDEAGGIWGLVRGQIDVSSAVSDLESPLADI